MRTSPKDEVLKELIDDMMSMDRERVGGKRRGPPSITIAIGVPKGGEESESGESEKECESCKGAGCPECEKMGEGMGAEMGMPAEAVEMEEDDEPDDEEDLLIEEAKTLGIKDPEYMDIRLLKKLVEKKRTAATV